MKTTRLPSTISVIETWSSQRSATSMIAPKRLVEGTRSSSRIEATASARVAASEVKSWISCVSLSKT